MTPESVEQTKRCVMTNGLDGVVATETTLSHVDGEAGRLILRGFDIEALAGQNAFETVAGLLWEGLASGPTDEAALRAALGSARERAFEIALPLLPRAVTLAPVEGLRFLLAFLPDDEPAPHHVLATAAVPVLTAALARAGNGDRPIAPDRSLGQAEDFLRMLQANAPTPVKRRALEAYLVAIADHGLNASTFTARVIASTRAGLFSSIIGALCALKGPLHGGAPGPVLDMLDAIGTPERIEPWLTHALDTGERLMGFGHRIYRVRDPRADVLKRVLGTLRGGDGRIRFAEQVETAALRLLAARKQGHSLQTNVEFYTALLLEALAIPRASFTSVFAIGRVVGWTAHVLEQQRSMRIIRPLSAYIGPMPRAA